MTKNEAKKLGWKVTGLKSDMTAEKGRLIFMGPEAIVLAQIKMAEGEA